jgi:hypothetical protein
MGFCNELINVTKPEEILDAMGRPALGAISQLMSEGTSPDEVRLFLDPLPGCGPVNEFTGREEKVRAARTHDPEPEGLSLTCR